MLDVYVDFAQRFMAMPVHYGAKTASERFPGAVDTYCIEAMMQDGKALQAGTSHFLGQNFARAFDVKFATREGGQELVWATSWGVSTRLMGALIMSHSDDAGLVLPPRLAPIEVVLVPIYKGADQMEDTVSALRRIADALRAAGIRVKLDDDDTKRSGWKFAEYELKGVPLRIAMGPRDLENGTVELARRDTREKSVVPVDGLTDRVRTLLDDIQTSLLTRAAQRTADTTHTVDSWDDFVAALDRGGFVRAHWDGTPETEDRIKDETKATIRCIPLDTPDEPGLCVRTGAPSARRVLFARAY
jgi:prolyl-tRNA synthetase